MNNEIIKLNDTFFVTDLNETEVQGQRYYSFNALSYFLFGDETRFFVPKVSELYILENEKHMKEAIEVLGYSHMMQDYKPDDYNFDAIELTMSDEELSQECSRCLRCDHFGFGAFRGGRSTKW